ncbi:MAG: hypothetical protein O7J95_11880 [Planctomycetota bacterium]|nr:hypothetical protein [Planctomycetota bacterium]
MVMGAFVLPGCETKRNDRLISSSEFPTPKLVDMRVLSSKLSLLSAIFPTELGTMVLQRSAEARPLGRPAGALSRSTLLIYEKQEGAILSLDVRRDCAPGSPCFAPVRLHWTQQGLEDELLDTFGVNVLDPVISFSEPGEPNRQGIDPIPLRGAKFQGWFLAFESRSGSVLAFREDPSFRTVPPVRLSDNLDDLVFANFGRGNGLIMTVVIDGREINRQIQEEQARINRFAELEDGKILCLFSSNVRAVHLLELDLVPIQLDYDLTPGGPDTRFVLAPQGNFRLFPTPAGVEPFLNNRFIQEEVTQNVRTDLDDMQPLFIPPGESSFCEDDTLPDGGKLLVFDAESSTFLLISEDDISGRGRVEAAATADELVDLLQKSPPLFMSQGTYGRGCNPALIFEETSNTLFGIDFLTSGALEKTVDPGALAQRRDLDVIRGDVIPSGEEPTLTVSVNPIPENRLYFDQGRDQILSVHLETGNVVILADRQDFEPITGRPLTNITWIEAIDGHETELAQTSQQVVLRAYDTESTTLLEIVVEYTVLPIVDRPN